MKAVQNYLGSKCWWIVTLAGILMVIGGFAYWFWPMAGYAIASQIFGWLLILVSIVQLIVAASADHPKDWGWWIVGGVIDMFIGFMLVRSIGLSEAVFPWFLAFVFVFWGFYALIQGIGYRSNRNWWLQIINGVLLLIIGFFFVEGGYRQDAYMVSFLTALAFIYWGFSIAMYSYELKPEKVEGE